ncbi:flexible cuticle protein 12-like [Pararge aegeria]|uniref:flexible cuticle protein 12-like n=1 Tax=Pararge aegeria TaxID=116150 RepID=UPI0019D01593|nr:flexible cuticle protein 12-like [Pararge aegeria]
MKSIIAFALCLAVVSALPTGDVDAEILTYENDNIGIGNYRYSFETSDGKKVSETSVVKNVGQENQAQEVTGSFSYYQNGQLYSVNYVADENGFRAVGDHIPK